MNKFFQTFNHNLSLIELDIKASVRHKLNYFKKQELAERIQKQKDRKEVLLLYRHMIKTIPKMEDSYFKQRHLHEFIKFNFNKGACETDIQVIMDLKNTCYIVIEKINKKVYPPFPKYYA